MKKVTVIPAPSARASNQPKPPKGQAGIYIGVFVLFFFLAASAYAKPQPPPQLTTADDIVAKMKIQLGLTDQQAGKVKGIIADYLAKEKQLKLEEKKQLSKVLTGQQLYTWNFLHNDPPRDKKKHLTLF